MTKLASTEVDRELSPEQARAYLAQPITPEEREGVQDLIRWFCSRYRSPAERLDYARRAYRRWTQTQATVPYRSPTNGVDDGSGKQD